MATPSPASLSFIEKLTRIGHQLDDFEEGLRDDQRILNEELLPKLRNVDPDLVVDELDELGGIIQEMGESVEELYQEMKDLVLVSVRPKDLKKLKGLGYITDEDLPLDEEEEEEDLTAEPAED
ncbi:hypothetical protein HS088_TW13G00761 [Tripterygium wilfordii]|uniref:Uncharacterized protein n=1 Tax=Tripterygium wilfordii TaxID=458696 RepID=A0A7J7CUW1_TRIWF|nr:hypothetical protein HS088_TW13G00761 [Tripterygium wilfordii]